MADLYKVVLKGKPILGWARADVIENLAKMMKIHPDKANDLLQGEPLIIKQNIEHFQAEKLAKTFRDAGVDCDIIKLAAPAPSKKKARRPANAMECPKCGHVQQKGLEECGGCGVLFAKLEAIAEAERQAKAAAEAPKPHFLEDLAHFIGPKQDFYINRVEIFRQRQGAFAWTWNWGAFLTGFWWCLYRRMPLVAVVAFVGMCIPGVQVLVLIALGGVANYIYFQHAKKKISKIREARPSGDISKQLAAAGGVNRGIPVIAIALTVLIVGLAVALPYFSSYRVAQRLKNIPRTALLKPTFQTSEGFKEAGSACVVEVPEYERYLLLTTHHLFSPTGGFEKTYAWNEIRGLVQQVNATTPANLALVVSTKEVLQIPNASMFTGQKVSGDLAVFPLPDKPPVPAFRMATVLPQPGEQVWLMAFSATGTDSQVALYGAKVVQSEDAVVTIQFSRSDLNLTEASGAPVLDGNGALAGVLVIDARQGKLLYGFINPSTEIRRMIEEGFKL